MSLDDRLASLSEAGKTLFRSAIGGARAGGAGGDDDSDGGDGWDPAQQAPAPAFGYVHGASTRAPRLGAAPARTSASASSATRGVELDVTQEYRVDPESVRAHGLISVPKGAVVRLVDGDPLLGLPPPYADYVLGEHRGRRGKVSKFVVRRRGFTTGKSARSLIQHDAVLE